MIKHEHDSADLTMSRIPISSRGTSGEEDAAKAEEESKQSAQMSEIVVQKNTMKRQMTMDKEQALGSLDMAEKEDRTDRISMPGAKKRINSDFMEPKPRSNDGPMMVVGQGYSQKQKSDLKSASN